MGYVGGLLLRDAAATLLLLAAQLLLHLSGRSVPGRSERLKGHCDSALIDASRIRAQLQL